MQASVVVFLLAWFRLATTNEESDGEVHFTNSWAVHIENDDFEAVNNIALKHGFINQGQIGSLPGYYHFVKHNVRERSRRSLDDHSDTLLSEPRVKWVQQQRILERSKRDFIQGEDELVQRSVATLRQDTAFTIRDPFFKDQWYLQNIGQSSGPSGVDISVLPVWARGYSGKGVVVSVLDDGLDHTHPDLRRNYDPDASFDFNDFDGDPKPRDENLENCHGTKCAGEVAAEANNGICGVGVSFNASIGGIRMLDGKATDTIEGSSLSYRSEYIDIYSCCWGPKDDGKRFGKPGHLASKALQIGTQRGRGGKGSIFVWATGNGGLTDDDCNCDGYTTSIYTISIGAISDHGLSTYYTETCASTLAVTFSGGSHRESVENRVVTTDLHHKCTEVFKGTSSAAPLAAGMLALVLEANPTLTWRDVQHVIVESSQVTSPLDEGWKTNGAGKRYNHKFGFGRLDVSKMVEMALRWKNVNRQRICHGASHNNKRFIPNSGSLLLSANTSSCSSTPSEIRRLEHVQINVTLQHRHRGDLSITLISPSGTRSKMLTTRRNDHSALGLKNWLFMTVHFWGEDPRGLWTVVITDNDNNNREHYLKKHPQGDEEDVTRVFMDETGKHREMPTNDQQSFKVDHAQDHIMKTMEDTAGGIFRGNRFTVSSRRKKLQHIHDKPSLTVNHKNFLKKHPFNNAAKLHRKKVKEDQLAQFKKHYLKSKAKSKVETSKGKHHWTRKHSNSNMNAFKGKHVRRIPNKHAMFKKLPTRKIFSEKQEKLKNTSVREDNKGSVKKPRKVEGQRLNVTLNMAPEAATNLSTSVASILGKSENATRAFGLISQLIDEIQKNPLVTKIAAEALKNPDLGKLFGIESSRDVLENIQGTRSPTKSINHNREDFKNRTKINEKDFGMETRFADKENGSVIAGVNKTSDHFETAKQGTIKSNKHKHIQFFKVLKDNRDHNSDITASGMDGSGGMVSGNYFDEHASGNLNLGNILKTEILRCRGSTNCRGAEEEKTSLSVSNKLAEEGQRENDAYEVYNGDKESNQYSESTDDGGEVFGSEKKPTLLEGDEDNDDLITEFGFNLNSIDGDTSDLCNFSLDSTNASLAIQKAHCLENSTMDKRADVRDKEDKNLAHYLAVDKLNSASGEDSADNNDATDGSPFKSKFRGDQDNSDTKYDGKDLEVLQEALENQLSRLSKDPASEKSNADILARVREDIKHGDIDDLELLEAQITGGKNELSRDVRSTTPDDNEDDDVDDNDDDDSRPLGGFDEEYVEIERRRISRQADNEKLSKTYYIDPDEYGKDNSGILESWTLILYGTK